MLELDVAAQADRNPHDELIGPRSQRHRDRLDRIVRDQLRLDPQVGHLVVGGQVAAVVGVEVADRPVAPVRGIPVPVNDPVARPDPRPGPVHESLLGSHPAGPLRPVSPPRAERPAREPVGVAGLIPAVVHQHPHRPLVGQRLAHDLTVGVDVPVGNPDRLARQPHDALDVGLRRVAGEVEDGDLPPLGRTEVVEELLHEHAVAAAIEAPAGDRDRLRRSSGRSPAPSGPPRRSRRRTGSGSSSRSAPDASRAASAPSSPSAPRTPRPRRSGPAPRIPSGTRAARRSDAPGRGPHSRPGNLVYRRSRVHPP